MEQAGFRKVYVVGDRIVNVRWVMGRAREHHKNVCCINYSNAFDSAEHFEIGNITNMGVLVCLIVLIQGGSNMTGTDLCLNKPHCAAAVRP